MISSVKRNTIGYTIVLFVAGAICGAAVMARMAPQPQSEPLKLGRVDEIVGKIQTKLSDKLKLTPAQLEKADPAIKRTSEKLESIHHDCLAMIAAALTDLHTQITPDLTPEQMELLKALDAERAESMWQKYHFRADTTNATVK